MFLSDRRGTLSALWLIPLLLGTNGCTDDAEALIPLLIFYSFSPAPREPQVPLVHLSIFW